MDVTSFEINELNVLVQEIVDTIGYSKAVKLLKSFQNNSDVTYKTPSKAKTQITFLKSKVIELFSLNEDDFLESKITEYKDARRICIHIMKKHSTLSYGKLGEYFGMSERQIKYRVCEVDKMLSVKRFYPEFTDNYSTIEGKFNEFKAKLG